MASWKNEEEMREWVRRARRGDPAAREELILGNLGLVRSVVKKLASSLSHDEEDLIQYGIIGLIRAVDGFDPDRGTRFSTYAVPFIGGAILEGMRKLQGIPRKVWECWSAVQEAHDYLAQDLGRAPTEKEIADRLGWREEEVEEVLIWGPVLLPDSFDELTESGGEWDVPSMAPDASETALVRLTDGLDERWVKALQCLKLREKEVVWLHAVEEWPHAAIAEQLGTSEGNVKVIYHRAKEKLRGCLGGEEGGVRDAAA